MSHLNSMTLTLLRRKSLPMLGFGDSGHPPPLLGPSTS